MDGLVSVIGYCPTFLLSSFRYKLLSLSATVDVSGNLTCAGTITPTAPVKGGAGKIALYGVQAAENRFEGAGSGQLSRGSVVEGFEVPDLWIFAANHQVNCCKVAIELGDPKKGRRKSAYLC